MVRLKALLQLSKGFVSRLFQFHYGTIKSTLSPAFMADKDNFNSTMVRLKVIMCIYHALPLLFQFHYGTIKSLLPELL